MKLVHLVGFITKKFVTMHGHMNVTERERERERDLVANQQELWIAKFRNKIMKNPFQRPNTQRNVNM